MFEKKVTQGFVFKKEDTREADRIFSIFTLDFGKIEAIARGIRKINSKLKSKVDIFSFLEIEFVEGKFQTILTGAQEILVFPKIKQNLSRTILAFEISEVLGKLIKEKEKNEKIFELIKEVFLNLQFFPLKKILLLYLYFLWNLISFAGYRPKIEKCNLCQETPHSFGFFDFSNFSFICQKCAKNVKIQDKITFRELKVLKIIFLQDLSFLKRLKLENRDLENILKISKKYFNFIVNENENI